MDRETKKITTSGNHTVEVYTYLTNGESRELQRVFAKAATIETDQTDPKGGSAISVSGDVAIEVEEKALKILIVSFDGDKTNPADRFDQLPAKEANEVRAFINELTKGAITPDFLGK